jgi:hypothetical protein
VLLLPASDDAEPRLAFPAASPGSDGWIARFEGLGPGEYLVAFEPFGR